MPRKRIDIAAIPDFQAGDLITAPALNRLLDAIRDLNARLATLEKKCGSKSA
ncbi:hypothetical protein [Sphingomonas arenae]|uniref:hypothetical protein n=1 Tax=Sphingomonas arenae TaxID=2812555 RepID=UPI00196878BC|nr:hypothetical protein [Sphingomonas arenae]